MLWKLQVHACQAHVKHQAKGVFIHDLLAP